MKEQKPVISIILVVINVAVLAAGYLLGQQDAWIQSGGIYAPAILNGEGYRLFVSMFLHSGIMHLCNNLIALILFGQHLEKLLGHVRFLLIYLLGGLLGSVFETMWYTATGAQTLAIGASGAIFALMGAMVYLGLFRRKIISGIRMPNLIIAIVVSLLPGLYEPGVSFTGHLFGLVGGFIVSIFICIGLKRRAQRMTGERE